MCKKLCPNVQDNCAGFSFIGPSSKTMADQQQLVLVVDTDAQGFPVLDDQSINGSNESPIVIEYPKDRLGPTEDAPTRTFYLYAPVLHWHESPTINESTCWVEMCAGQNLQERERKETRSRLKKIFPVPLFFAFSLS